VAGIPIHGRTGQKMFLSGYLAMVLFALSGLILRGGVFVLVGLACWSFALLGCILYHNKSGIAEYLKIDLTNSERYIGEEKARALCVN
jgi:hypothetical protein